MKHDNRYLAIAVISASAVFGSTDTRAADNAFMQTNLVSDGAVTAQTTDPDLKNAWGVAFFPGGPFWIADNGAGLATLYDGTGAKQSLTVTIPPPNGSPPGTASAPTGLVWNGTTQFRLPGTTLPSLFIFDTEDGTVGGWNPGTSDPTHAVVVVDNSQNDAVYKALAFGSNAKGNFLFATNFHAGTVDVFDSSFAPATLDGKFADPDIPAGFAPFGIRNIDGDLVVTYALQNGEKHDDVAGPGNGFVDIFDTDGHLIRRFASKGDLNSPWGIARAPFEFGPFGGDILIGNFGDGRITAFSQDGTQLDQLKGADGMLLTIDGLWSLAFGGAAKSSPDTLYFTAGPNDEQDGLFGSIAPAPSGSSMATAQ
ncbi:MAG TPA: TIGR03118 family protein [Stellaceae bacterium]